MNRATRVFIVLLLVSACGSTVPVVPDGAALVIKPDTDALRINEGEAFQVVRTLADGTQREVSAQWVSLDPTTIAIDSAGRAVGLRLGRSRLVASFEGIEATRDVQVVSDFSGSWTGQGTWTQCTRVSGPGPNPCNGIIGEGFSIVMNLSQSHRTAAGQLTIYAEPTTGNVTGSVNNDNQLVLTGILMGAPHPVTVRIGSWTSVIDVNTSIHSGTFSARVEFTNGFGPQVDDEAYQFANLIRR